MGEYNGIKVVTWLKSRKDYYTEKDNTFYKNDELLEKEINGEDNKKIDKSEFQDFIKREVSNFVDRKFNRIVLLTGAGSSVTGDSDNIIGKTMNDLIKDIIGELQNKEDYFDINEMINLCKYELEDN